MIPEKNSVPVRTFVLIVVAGIMLLSNPVFAQQGFPGVRPQVTQVQVINLSAPSPIHGHYGPSEETSPPPGCTTCRTGQEDGFVWRFANPQLTDASGTPVAANTATHLQFDVEIRGTARLQAIGGFSVLALGMHWENVGGMGTGGLLAGDQTAGTGFPFACTLEDN